MFLLNTLDLAHSNNLTPVVISDSRYDGKIVGNNAGMICYSCFSADTFIIDKNSNCSCLLLVILTFFSSVHFVQNRF